MIDRNTEKLVAAILTVIIVIWGILEILMSFGVFTNNLKTIEQYNTYAAFATRIVLVTIPIIIASLALIPIINEDMKIVSYISYVIAIVSSLVFIFIPASAPDFLTKLLLIDILMLVVCSVRTTSSTHKKFKIGLLILVLLTVFLIYDSANSSYYDELVISSASSYTDSKILIVLLSLTIVGILLNPCIAMITEDYSYSDFGSPSNDSKPNNYERLENESPLEMYNRLIAEQNQNGNSPGVEKAPVAEPTPTPESRPIGPNSGAVINPIAAVINPNPASAPQTPPLEGDANQQQETFEVPSSMAFLFDNTEDKDK